MKGYNEPDRIKSLPIDEHMQSKKSVKRLSPGVWLSIAILLTALFLYSPYIFGDRLLVYTFDLVGDTFHAYLPAYQFFANLIRDGGSGAYSFAYGLGTSLFTPINWVTNPFDIISVLYGAAFGPERIGEVLVYVQILKILCAGLLCMYFLKQYKFSDGACALSAYIYAFSGYMMTAGQHYFFSVYPVYFILLLLAAEKALNDHRKLPWLTIVTALVCLNGVYFAYMSLLAGALFVIIRAFQIKKRPFAVWVKDVLSLGVAMTLGLLVSAILFLPNIAVLLSSTRVDSSTSIFEIIKSYWSLASKEVIRSSFLRLFSNNLEGTVNSWHGYRYHADAFPFYYSALLVPMAVQYLWATLTMKTERRTKAVRILLLASVIFSIVCTFVPGLFNAFVTTAYYRFAFVFLPFFAFIVAETLHHIGNGCGYNRIANYMTIGISCIFVAIGGYRVYEIDTDVALTILETVLFLMIGGVLLDLLFLTAKLSHGRTHEFKMLTRTVTIALAAAICANLFIENYVAWNTERETLTKDVLEKDFVTAQLAQQVAAIEGDNFYRLESGYIEAGMPSWMFSLATPFRSCSYYDSIVTDVLPEFFGKMFLPSSFAHAAYPASYGGTIDPFIADILGLKYYACVI